MATQTPSDLEAMWIEQTRNGDQQAFQKLYESHVDSLFRFMRQFSKKGDEVEDWVQRAFIKAYRGIHQFKGAARFSSWLFRIAINEMQTDKRRMNIVSTVDSFDDLKTDHASVSEEFEWQATMKSYLDKLDEVKRMVFVLYEVEGYSHAEIASLLGVGESTSRTILSRTKQLLRTQWETERRTS